MILTGKPATSKNTFNILYRLLKPTWDFRECTHSQTLKAFCKKILGNNIPNRTHCALCALNNNHLITLQSELCSFLNDIILYDLGAKRAERSQNVQWTFCSRSQLAGWPFESQAATKKPIRHGWVFEVGAKGFEPLTPWV